MQEKLTNTETDPRLEKLKSDQEAVENSTYFTQKVLEHVSAGYITVDEALNAINNTLTAIKYVKSDDDAYQAIRESLQSANLTEKGLIHSRSHDEQFIGLTIYRINNYQR